MTEITIGTLVRFEDGAVGTVETCHRDGLGRGFHTVRMHDGTTRTQWTSRLAPIYVDDATIDRAETEHYRRLGI